MTGNCISAVSYTHLDVYKRQALQITPDVILTEDNPELSAKRAELFDLLDKCTIKQQETALELLSVYLKSIK